MRQPIAYIPRTVLDDFDLPTRGMRPDSDRAMYQAICEHLDFGPRAELEEDPTKKQIIPYVLIQRQHDIWTMVRTAKTQETRLHHRASVGVGGHLEPMDGSHEDIIVNGMLRELHEEVHIKEQWDQHVQYVGILNDDTNDVGKVHLGLVFLLHVLPQTNVEIRETEKMRGLWYPITQCQSSEDYTFETWSEIALQTMYPES